MKLLLAVDSSAASDLVAKEVAARPWPSGTTVQVLSVVEPGYGWSVPGLEESLRKSAEEAVAGAIEIVRRSGLTAIASIVAGDPKEAIIDQAVAMGADMVVVGANEASELARFLLGSVARAVLRFGHCSVEIVRGEARPGARRVLLATDGSPYSEDAARSVGARPWPAGTVVRILSVVELHIPLAHVPDYFDPKAMEEARGEAMRRTQDAVAFAEKAMCDAGLDNSTSIAIPTATPKELILNEANEWGADLIVVGSHGRRGFSRFLLGSVSESVALHAGCSVEIIRQPHR
jgi:nucleotide-binding universal stress UspA family protein